MSWLIIFSRKPASSALSSPPSSPLKAAKKASTGIGSFTPGPAALDPDVGVVSACCYLDEKGSGLEGCYLKGRLALSKFTHRLPDLALKVAILART